MARVDTNRALRVGTGPEPLTIAGTVTAKEARPSMYVRFIADQHNGWQTGYTIPDGKVLIITNVTTFLHNAGSGAKTEGLIFIGAAAAGCSTYVVAATSGTTTSETVVQNFDPGIAVQPGLTVHGYGQNKQRPKPCVRLLVPASAVPAVGQAASSRTSAQRTTTARG